MLYLRQPQSNIQDLMMILTLDFDAYLMGGQNALSKIAAKQYLRLLMLLDFDC